MLAHRILRSLLEVQFLSLFWLTTDAFSFTMTSAARPKIFDMPVSNNGARCRFIIYEKGLENDIDIVSPMDIGGLKSEQYLALNPHGKMPMLVTETGESIPESDTIARYLMDRFEGKGCSFIPSTLESRMKSEIICRLHDTYITTIQQGCMYKAVPPFGIHSSRVAALADLEAQLKTMESLASESGPFLAGEELSLADASVLPTMSFICFMMPKFGKEESSFLGPRLQAWWKHMCQHKVGGRIVEEITSPLKSWDAKGRWDTILHAGKRDTAPATIFDKILAKEIPSTVVFEDSSVLAFRDINPQAPTHVLIIPKKREGLTQLSEAMTDHEGLLGHMLVVAAKIAAQEEVESYRVVINNGGDAGQEVFHLHMHLIGGRPMKWPPG
ncbi:unnamed protein product [Discosporangium mesarthrocarpum]